MYNRKWIYMFISLTLIIAIVLNYRFFRIGFGMFLFLPMFGIILLYPRWLTGNICSLFMPVIQFLIEYLSKSGNISREFLIRLVTTSIISWIILLTFTLFIIKLFTLIQSLENLSLTDNLTNTFNRRYLELYSEKLLANSLSGRQPLCFLILDIDYFKTINDKYSHIAGDYVLQKLTKIIQKSIKQTDVLVRLGGEEFALILPNTSIEEGLKCAEIIRKAIQMTCFEFKGTQMPITISVGITKYTEGSLEYLYDQADQALYQSKANGRNQVTTFDSVLNLNLPFESNSENKEQNYIGSEQLVGTEKAAE